MKIACCVNCDTPEKNKAWLYCEYFEEAVAIPKFDETGELSACSYYTKKIKRMSVMKDNKEAVFALPFTIIAMIFFLMWATYPASDVNGAGLVYLGTGLAFSIIGLIVYVALYRIFHGSWEIFCNAQPLRKEIAKIKINNRRKK